MRSAQTQQLNERPPQTLLAKRAGLLELGDPVGVVAEDLFEDEAVVRAEGGSVLGDAGRGPRELEAGGLDRGLLVHRVRNLTG